MPPDSWPRAANPVGMLCRIEARDDHGWTFFVVLDPDHCTATIVLNDVLRHRTPLDDGGRFLVAPHWLPARMRVELEQRVALWLRTEGRALPGEAGTKPP